LQIRNQDGKKLRSKMKVVQKQKLKSRRKLRISITKSSRLETKETLEMITEGDTMIEMTDIKMMVKIETIKRIRENNSNM
jgi:hypothetical protein